VVLLELSVDLLVVNSSSKRVLVVGRKCQKPKESWTDSLTIGI
jgi:hypothetical protein